MTDLKNKLVRTVPRETSGARTLDRYDYAADWALCELLRRHIDGQDYLVVLDYHDDVLILAPSGEPSSISCYQIKTKQAGSWSLQSLLKPKAGKGGTPLPSILGKLYGHFISFNSHIKTLCFVSNASVTLELHDGSSPSEHKAITFDKLSEPHRLAIAEAIKAQHNLSSPADGCVHLAWSRSDLSLREHSVHALGHITEFLSAQPSTDPGKAIGFYRTLKDEIVKACRHEGLPPDFEDLCKFKAISRPRFEQMLREVAAAEAPADFASHISHRLDTEHVDAGFSRAMFAALKKLAIRRMDPTDVLLTQSVTIVRAAISDLKPSQAKLIDQIAAVYDHCRSKLNAIAETSNDTYVRAIIAVELYEQPQL